ncbi:MAG: GNAT family N-acetyltransferase [Actinomycetota bacterium]|nr:GNAT family N-acetyltransferase [Actinomycetota bacterium]
MTTAELETFMDGQVERDVGVRQQAGESPDVALATAIRQFAELLPDGVRSPDQYPFTALDGDEPVGTLWLGTERPGAFIYDVIVRPEHRRKGYGEAIMVAAAQWVEDRGGFAPGLDVFGRNAGARALYDGLGFAVTEENHRMALR